MSKNAWAEQHVENFLWSIGRSEKDHPQYPRCAHLASAWLRQFEIPGCSVSPFLATNSSAVVLLASFYACLDKPTDGEALALHSLFEARWATYWNAEDKFKDRYRQLTRPIFGQLADGNYTHLQERFKMNNPNASRYCVDWNEAANKPGRLGVVPSSNDAVCTFGIFPREFESSDANVVLHKMGKLMQPEN